MTDQFDRAYYERLEQRAIALIHEFETLFPSEQIKLLLELADHNEPGIAVEMLSSMLVETARPVTTRLRDEFQGLADDMHLDAAVWRDLSLTRAD